TLLSRGPNVWSLLRHSLVNSTDDNCLVRSIRPRSSIAANCGPVMGGSQRQRRTRSPAAGDLDSCDCERLYLSRSCLGCPRLSFPSWRWIGALCANRAGASAQVLARVLKVWWGQALGSAWVWARVSQLHGLCRSKAALPPLQPHPSPLREIAY